MTLTFGDIRVSFCGALDVRFGEPCSRLQLSTCLERETPFGIGPIPAHRPLEAALLRLLCAAGLPAPP